MKMKVILISFLMSLSFGGNSDAQISCIPPPLHDLTGLNHTRMHGSILKQTSFDLPFIDEVESKLKYSQLWINTDVLNVRTGPSSKDSIITEVYFGQRVFAYAKKGDWVAILRPVSTENVKWGARWVNIRYLSSQPIKEQVGLKVLKRKCSFKKHRNYNPSKAISDAENKILNSCSAVRTYLRHQRCQFTAHPYEKEYENWRRSQTNPDIYKDL